MTLLGYRESSFVASAQLSEPPRVIRPIGLEEMAVDWGKNEPRSERLTIPTAKPLRSQ